MSLLPMTVNVHPTSLSPGMLSDTSSQRRSVIFPRSTERADGSNTYDRSMRSLLCARRRLSIKARRTSATFSSTSCLAHSCDTLFIQKNRRKADQVAEEERSDKPEVDGNAKLVGRRQVPQKRKQPGEKIDIADKVRLRFVTFN
jgi:hypothetical protein